MRVSSVVRIIAVGMVVVVAALGPTGAFAQSERDLRAIPFVFIGNDGDCGPGTFGSHIVTTAWLGGMGLPDRGGDTALNGVAATKDDPHRGLLLSKNGPSPDCSSAGARIVGAQGVTVDATNSVKNTDVQSGDAIEHNVSQVMQCNTPGCYRELLLLLNFAPSEETIRYVPANRPIPFRKSDPTFSQRLSDPFQKHLLGAPY